MRIVVLAFLFPALLVSACVPWSNSCPDADARYLPSGRQVTEAAACDDTGAEEGVCAYACIDETTCAGLAGISCEPCDAIEAFASGGCVDCERKSNEGYVYFTCVSK